MTDPRRFAFILLLTAATAGAQDVFNATSGTGGCEAAKAAIRERYNQTVAPIERARRAAGEEKSRAEANCGTGDSSKQCRSDVDKQYDKTNDRLNDEEYRAGTERDKALADAERNCAQSAPLRGGDTYDAGGGGISKKTSGGASQSGQASGRPDSNGTAPPNTGAAADSSPPCMMAASVKQGLDLTRIDNAQDVARLIFARYNTNQPIGIARVKNLYNTYLVVLSGTEPQNLGQPTNLPEDISSANTQGDSFSRAVFEAMIRNVPRGANVILAGHSLGGMEAQNVANNPMFNELGYRLTRVVTFGSPKTVTPAPGTEGNYSRFAARGDPIISSVFWRKFDNSDQIAVGKQVGVLGGLGAHGSYPELPELLQYDALGMRKGTGSAIQLTLDWDCFGAFSVGRLL